MAIRSRARCLLFLPVLISFVLAGQSAASAPVLPNPELHLTGTEPLQQGAKHFIRYHFDVTNKNQYPDEMFAASPNLPPCGANNKASRTWIDFYDQGGKRLNGFCALTKAADLNQIWFQLEEGVIPPSYVYIELLDRETNTKYKSNLAETSQ